MVLHGLNEAAPSAKQIVFLFMASTVVAVVVFLCGVLVGRGVPARPAADGPSFGGFGGPLPFEDEPPSAIPGSASGGRRRARGPGTTSPILADLVVLSRSPRRCGTTSRLRSPS